ncbi:MAG: rRNA maturation RNase YbeY [Nitrospirae bacterium]|nr:rRNA maturation RNase YbeY [Nitrospirota bacterium]
MRILIRDRQRRRRLNKGRISKCSRRILTLLNQPKAELSILFVGEKKMAGLNSEYRGIHKSTDVLSFPQISEKWEVRSKKLKKGNKPGGEFHTSHFSLLTSHFVLGDIVISVPKAEAQAKTNGLGFYQEVRRLLIHGILHLLGYDHERSVYHEKRMKKKEQEIFHATQEMG